MILFTPYVVDFIFKIRKYLSINRFEGKTLLVKLQNLDFKKPNKLLSNWLRNDSNEPKFVRQKKL